MVQTQNTSSGLKKIDVSIMESWTQVQGKKWPSSSKNEPLSMTAAEEPHIIVIHFPSGKKIETYSKTTLISLDKKLEKVQSISCLPYENTLTFAQALQAALELFNKLGFRDQDFLENVNQWTRDPFGKTTKIVRMNFEKSVLVEASLKSQPNIADAWFLSLDFHASVE